MEQIKAIQQAIDLIDEQITDKLTITQLANAANFSVYHFSRLFTNLTGMSVMVYVTRRKLQFALYDLCRGKKIVDAAMEYGFETHAGFTKAFKRCFGYPPSLYRIHAEATLPKRIILSEIKKHLLGGTMLQPQIINMNAFVIVGYTSQHVMPDVTRTGDIPAYWDTINMEYANPLTLLHDNFTKSKHCEYSVCFDANLATGAFTYLLGVGIDNDEDMDQIQSDMFKKEMPGGLYAVFTTPQVQSEKYTESIHDLWKTILEDWLPNSQYEYDEERWDFEYYDERDHAWEHNNKVQMDICIPIRNRQ